MATVTAPAAPALFNMFLRPCSIMLSPENESLCPELYITFLLKPKRKPSSTLRATPKDFSEQRSINDLAQ
jgi:hypothetical protein